MITVTSGIKVTNNAVADPDLELRGGAPPPGPSRRSATAMYAEKA